MLQVLNSRERARAFVQFLVFFLVTIILILTASFFDFFVPAKENDNLYSRLEVENRQDQQEQQFVNSMLLAKSLLDSVNKPGTPSRAQLSLKLTARLNELDNLAEKTTSVSATMQKTVTTLISELAASSAENVAFKEKLDALQPVKDELKDCKAERDNLEALLNSYRTTRP